MKFTFVVILYLFWPVYLSAGACSSRSLPERQPCAALKLPGVHPQREITSFGHHPFGLPSDQEITTCLERVRAKSAELERNQYKNPYPFIPGISKLYASANANVLASQKKLMEIHLGFKTEFGNLAVNLQEAIFWTFRCASQEDPDCLAQLGYLHAEPKSLIKPDKRMEVCLTWMAIDKGAFSPPAIALSNMGIFFEYGHGGIKVDHKMAFLYYTQSAEKNGLEGMYRAGLCLLNGIGTDKDLLEAKRLFTKASALGHQKARDELNKLPEDELCETSEIPIDTPAPSILSPIPPPNAAPKAEAPPVEQAAQKEEAPPVEQKEPPAAKGAEKCLEQEPPNEQPCSIS